MVLLALGGCTPSDHIIAKCEVETRKAGPLYAKDFSMPMTNMMLRCMRAEGWTWTMRSDDCQVEPFGDHPYVNPACYEDAGWYNLRATVYDWILERRMSSRSR